MKKVDAQFVAHRLRTELHGGEQISPAYGGTTPMGDFDAIAAVSSVSTSSDYVGIYRLGANGVLTLMGSWIGVKEYQGQSVAFTDAGTVAVFCNNVNAPTTLINFMDTYTAQVTTPPKVAVTETGRLTTTFAHYMHHDLYAKDGDLIFSTGGNTFPLSGVSVTSVADPMAPQAISSLTLPGHGTRGVARIGTGSSRRLFIGGATAGISGGQQQLYLYSVDASDPSNMSIIGSINLSAYTTASGRLPIAVKTISDSLVAISFAETGVRLINVSNPASMSIIGGLAAGGLMTSTGIDMVALTSNLLIYLQSDRLLAINVSNPASPTILSSFARQFAASSYNYERIIRYSDTMAVVTQSAGGIATIDFSNPSLPVRRASQALNGTAWSLDKGIVKGNI